MARDDTAPVSLDLVPIELIAPRLKRVAAFAVLIGVVVGVIVGFFGPVWVGVTVGAVIAVPTAASALLTLRRRVTLQTGRIRSTGDCAAGTSTSRGRSRRNWWSVRLGSAR